MGGKGEHRGDAAVAWPQGRDRGTRSAVDGDAPGVQGKRGSEKRCRDRWDVREDRGGHVMDDLAKTPWHLAGRSSASSAERGTCGTGPPVAASSRGEQAARLAIPAPARERRLHATPRGRRGHAPGAPAMASRASLASRIRRSSARSARENRRMPASKAALACGRAAAGERPRVSGACRGAGDAPPGRVGACETVSCGACASEVRGRGKTGRARREENMEIAVGRGAGEQGR